MQRPRQQSLRELCAWRASVEPTVPPGDRSPKGGGSVGGPFFAGRLPNVSKVSLSISQQLEQLDRRGLLDSQKELPRALMTQGYFRLSGYWRYFQIEPTQGRNTFHHGTDFADIYSMYLLDAELRNLLLEGLAQVEIALRASLTANLCTPGGLGTEYQDTSTYDPAAGDDGKPLREGLLANVNDDIDRSKERHVRHHRNAGTVPLWVATEALSFGTVSRMYGLLVDEKAKSSVAKRFGYVDGLTTSMRSNLRSVAVFRNVCAHHGRIWNKVIHADKPRLFPGAFPAQPDFRTHHDTPWGVISVLGHFVRNVRGNDSFMNDVNSLVQRNSHYSTGLKSPSRV